MKENEFKPFACDNGRVYNFPPKHCAFCKNCTNVLFDSKGPYLFPCNIGKNDFRSCGRFEPDEAETECRGQIEEMEMTPLDVLANDIYQHCPDLKENYCGDTHCEACLANALYNAGYRKQMYGEWVYGENDIPHCSECGHEPKEISPFCPACGTKMEDDE